MYKFTPRSIYNKLNRYKHKSSKVSCNTNKSHTIKERVGCRNSTIPASAQKATIAIKVLKDLRGSMGKSGTVHV